MIAKKPCVKDSPPESESMFDIGEVEYIGHREAFLVRDMQKYHLVVESFKGIDNCRAFGVTILIFIRVHDPKTHFEEHLTMTNLDRLTCSIGPREPLLARVDTKISLRVDFLVGAVTWKIN